MTKFIKIASIVFVIALGFFAVMFGIERFGGKNDTKQADTTVYADTTLYTEELCKDIIGYNSNIPLEINVEDNKISHIKILDNQETPIFFQKVTDAGLVEKFYGLTPKEAVDLKIDAVSGATFSSNAIIKSVKKSMGTLCKTDDTAVEAQSTWTWPLIGIICCAVVLCVLSVCRKKCN